MTANAGTLDGPDLHSIEFLDVSLVQFLQLYRADGYKGEKHSSVFVYTGHLLVCT